MLQPGRCKRIYRGSKANGAFARPPRLPGGCAAALALLLATGLAQAADGAPAPAVDQPASTQETMEEQDQSLLDHLLSPTDTPVRTILVDREIPLLGLTWGANVQMDTPLNDEPDGASPTLRQAKLSYSKVFNEDWAARAMVNYNNAGDFELGNNFVIYTGWKSSTATFGVFDPAFSLEKVTSRSAITFLERALPVEALSERRSGGVSFLRRTPKSILNAGLFAFSPDYQGQSESGQAIALHYVHSPLERKSERRLFDGSIIRGRKIWAGLSLSYRANASGPNTQFRSKPEVATIDDYYVDTGPISGAKRILRLGLEASKVAGPFSWQAELLTAHVARDDAETVRFWGAYVFASWFLTGESRHYEPLTGRFISVRPDNPLGHGGWGAFELAGRLSYVDLNDEDLVGGEQTNLSLGLNWYVNRRWRLMLNLIKVMDVNRPGSVYDGLAPLSLTLRAQWYLD